MTGVYETVHLVSCDVGYVTQEIKSTFLAECQYNGIWNLTTCLSKYYLDTYLGPFSLWIDNVNLLYRQ